ncbi:ankyrin repeat protein [Klebsormidium nitens]|uniref:Ankyrin repeat protein n=1 Tax=Klebsormidium nitens TaxID=105231 RepID=A0A1Y1IB50_KLENI|nr:ankyrin repeat protein [Klebsormidium nitens]|eukprot:GAQ85926.1 ankyrin repeat protein [Klebsormidium nitens]
MQAKQQEWPPAWQPKGLESEPLVPTQGAEIRKGTGDRQKARHWAEYLPSTTSLDTDGDLDDGDSVNGEPPPPSMKPITKPAPQQDASLVKRPAALDPASAFVQAFQVLSAEDRARVAAASRTHCVVESRRESLQAGEQRRAPKAAVEMVPVEGATMHSDASAGDVGAVRRRLEARENVDAVSHELGGQTALHVASGQGRTATVDLLVRAGAQLEVRDDGGLTPLHFAASNGQTATVALLIKLGADKEARTDFYQTPLHVAAGHGRSATVDVLLRNGADVNSITNLGQTPLHLAAALGQTSTVSILLRHGADKEAQDDGGLTALHGACENGRAATVDLLLRSGADKEARDKGGQTPLHIAAENGQTGTVELLLQHEADIESKTDYAHTPLHAAARNGRTAVVELLLLKGACKDATTNLRQSPLHIAASMGRTATVGVLIRAGVLKDAEDDLRQTPLHLAAANAQIAAQTVDLLLRSGANKDARDDYGRTPLQLAAKHGQTPTLELLLKATYPPEASSKPRAAQRPPTQTTAGAPQPVSANIQWTVPGLEFSAANTVGAKGSVGQSVDARQGKENRQRLR